MCESRRTNDDAVETHSIELKGQSEEATPVEIDIFMQFLVSIINRRLAEDTEFENQSKAS